MKKMLSTLVVVAATILPIVTRAQESSSVSYNIGVISDFRPRGISLSGLNPALQGGIDFAHPRGIYAGTWASTIRWVKDSGKLVKPNADSGSTPIEWDIYGGYRGKLGSRGPGFDVGVLAYVYPGNKIGNAGGVNANTAEVYGALTMSVLTAKYSHSMTNLFGFSDSKGSSYLEASANVDLGHGWAVVPHVGHQEIKNNRVFSYSDYSVSVFKTLGGGFTLSAAMIGTDAGEDVYITPSGKFTGKNMAMIGAKYNF
jgi:uncharacterized protein (TIGR02001 family)